MNNNSSPRFMSAFRKVSTVAWSLIACATALYIASATPVSAGGDSAKDMAKEPGDIIARALTDVPGKNLVVVALDFPPNPPKPANTHEQNMGHRHPGSTYVYVTKGSLR